MDTQAKRDLFDKLVAFEPEVGEKLDPSAVSAWINKWGVDRVKEAVLIYHKQMDKAKKNPALRKPQSAGKYLRNILNKGIKVESDSDKENISFAKMLQEKYSHFLNITERYCSIPLLSYDLYYNMPVNLFKQSLLSKLNLCGEAC